MAVMQNSIIFGGINSADFGIYIGGEGTFNAPKRAVEMVTVPGRNGDIAIDQGHYENIEVTYSAFNYEEDLATFAKQLSDFRNAIASQVGYQRLTDTFHPDEYRMAIYTDGLEIDPIKYNTASEFKLKFDCKPQRWLTSGEVPVTIGEWGATKTASGEIVTIESEGGEAAKSLVVELEPIQSGSGDPSPDNVRPISGRTEVVTWDDPKYGGTIEWNQLFSTTGIAGTFNGVIITTTGTTVTFKGSATANVYRTVYNATSHNGHVYYVTLSGANSNNVWLYNDSKGVALFGNGFAVQKATADSQFYIRLASGGVYDETITAQIFDLTQMFGETKANEIYAMEQAHVGDGATYFKSLFPKDYYDYNVGEETCVSAVNGDEYRKYTTALGRTVYGGTLDVVSGVLTVDRAMVDLGTLTWTAYGATASYDRYITAGIDSTVKEGTVGVCSHFQGSRTFAVGNIVIGSGGSKLSAFTPKGQYASASDFKTAMSGATFVYELATPQTYQLTPQQIELLLGENHVWSDGEISVEYGDDPNSLWNPTRYDAGPLLITDGYGTISFNGYDIEITHVPVGWVTLVNRGEKYLTTALPNSSGQYSVKWNSELLQRGDTINVASRSDRAHKITFGISNLTALDTYTYSNSNPNAIDMGVIGFAFDNVSFTAGTANTITNTLTVTPTGSGSSASWTGSIRYDGDSTITFSISKSSTDTFRFEGEGYVEWDSIESKSTAQAFGRPTYIDCELGEAYKIENDEVISLNKYLDLGSDLPKLSPGANDVTTDNTITELKVVPNWWKL